MLASMSVPPLFDALDSIELAAEAAEPSLPRSLQSNMEASMEHPGSSKAESDKTSEQEMESDKPGDPVCYLIGICTRHYTNSSRES
jgi:hypothetical protein